jgi:hypothetical protein
MNDFDTLTRNFGWVIWVMVLVMFFLGSLVLWGILGVPIQAARRGQGFIGWFLLQCVSLNPLYPMILVAMLPNRSRDRMRRQFASEIDQLLEETGADLPVLSRDEQSHRPDRSIGDAPTAASIGDMPTGDPVRQRSIGDMPTRDPVERSIGDMPTRDPAERSIGEDETRG